MKRYILIGLALIIVIGIIPGCSARKLDEKLDTEYNEVLFEVKIKVDKVDTMIDKIYWMWEDQKKQDKKIDRYVSSPEDRKKQDQHVEWFNEYEPTLIEMETWVKESKDMFLAHQEIEKEHNGAKSTQISTEHEVMISELKEIETEAETRFGELMDADSVMHVFFDEHLSLNRKYNIPSEEKISAPTFK